MMKVEVKEEFEFTPETDVKLQDKAPVVTKVKRRTKPRLKYRPDNGTVLDISPFDDQEPLEHQDIDLDDVSFLNHAFFHSHRMICIAGAGVSVAAGIPDFRSSDGLFNNLNNGQGKNLFDYQTVYRDPEMMSKFHEMIQSLYQMSMELKPTLFHHFLNYIASDDRLLRLYTQNVDGFELQLPHLQTDIPLMAKKTPPKCVQLHGNVQVMSCTKCHFKSQLDPSVFQKLQTNAPPPECPECAELDAVREVAGKRKLGSGSLRPRIVLYNEFHPDGEIIGQISQKDLKAKPDCLVIVGTTLKIPGVRTLARELARMVHSQRGCVIWINKDEPSMSVVDFLEFLDLIIVGDCQDVPKLLTKYACEIDGIKKKQAKEKRIMNAAMNRKTSKQSNIGFSNGQLDLQKAKPSTKTTTKNPSPNRVTKKREAN